MYLKTGHIDLNGESLEIVELNALGQKHMMEAHTKGDLFTAYAQVVKYGTKKWRDVEVEEILDSLPLVTIQEVADKILALSEIDASKNSVSGLSEGSSSA